MADEGEKNEFDLEKAISYVKQHPQINEVIFSGGEPFLCRSSFFERLMTELSLCENIKHIRIHSRALFLAPDLITQKLCVALSKSLKPLWIVVHVNSAQEITSAGVSAIKKLQEQGFYILSQSVLLKGVNDSVEKLSTLFTELLNLKIRPYYLHYPDLVLGTSHFRIPLMQALEIYNSLQNHISGIAIPKLMFDLPGGQGKVSLLSARASSNPDTWIFVSPLSGKEVLVSF